MRVMTADEMCAGDQRVERLVDANMVEVTTVPRGRKGLWGALAVTLTPRITERGLPLTDTSTVGVGVSMFDYDPGTAIRLEPA